MNNYLDLTIKEIHEALLEGKTTPLELTKEALRRAKENKDNAFEMIIEEDAINKATELSKLPVPKDNYFFGIPYVAKDNYSTKGYETTASSDVLNGYIPLFDATVIKLLNEAGAILIGKSTLDELAMGGTGTSGHKGVTFNPWDKTHSRIVGGSSAGSTVAVSDAIVPFALGSDTGDSVRKPASLAGLVGFKPTWGLISRFGLFPFAPSLDHVAYFTRSVFDSALATNLLAKHDENDSTCSYKTRDDYTSYNSDVKDKRIAIINGIYKSISDEEVLKSFDKSIEYLKKNGAKVEFIDVNLDLLKAIYPAYIVISSAEATSNDANLDGIKFGPNYGGKTYEEVMFNARTKGFSALIKRRFVLGSYALMRENQEEVFLRAQKARRLIVNEFNKIFEKFDAIYCPASPSVAPLINKSSDEVNEDFMIADNWLAIGNFGGYPSITLPIGFENDLPLGANLTCKPFDEVKLFGIASKIEEGTGLENLSYPSYMAKKEEK